MRTQSVFLLVVLSLLAANIYAAMSMESISAKAYCKAVDCVKHCSNKSSEQQAICEYSCKMFCDPRVQDKVMSDALFLKKIGKKFKKIGKVVKKVSKVVGKVTSLPTKVLGKVVDKLPVPKVIKNVIKIAAPIALGFVTGGAGGLGALSNIKQLAGVGKVINAVKTSKAFTTAMKIKKTVDTVRNKVQAVKGIVKGKISAVTGLVNGKISGIKSNFISKLKDSKAFKTYENIRGKVKNTVDRIKKPVDAIQARVNNFKNKTLGKLDRFGAIGRFAKQQANDRINQFGRKIKDKVRSKVENLKQKVMDRTGITRIREKINKFEDKVRGKIQNFKQKMMDKTGITKINRLRERVHQFGQRMRRPFEQVSEALDIPDQQTEQNQQDEQQEQPDQPEQVQEEAVVEQNQSIETENTQDQEPQQ